MLRYVSQIIKINLQYIESIILYCILNILLNIIILIDNTTFKYIFLYFNILLINIYNKAYSK